MRDAPDHKSTATEMKFREERAPSALPVPEQAALSASEGAARQSAGRWSRLAGVAAFVRAVFVPGKDEQKPDAALPELARGLLADPELPNKVMANRGDEVVKCVRCFACMAERPVTQTRRCAVNPRIGREFEGLEVVPAAAPKRVLVAGGGIAGMMAAHTAALRGHQVILMEKESELGGILKSCLLYTSDAADD